jgi:hypothetical protein
MNSSTNSIWHQLRNAGVPELQQSESRQITPPEHFAWRRHDLTPAWFAEVATYIQNEIPGTCFAQKQLPIGALRLFIPKIPWNNTVQATPLSDLTAVQMLGIENDKQQGGSVMFNSQANMRMHHITYQWLRYNNNPQDLGAYRMSDALRSVLHKMDYPRPCVCNAIPVGTIVVVGKIPGTVRAILKQEQSYLENPYNHTIVIDWPSLIIMKVD